MEISNYHFRRFIIITLIAMFLFSIFGFETENYAASTTGSSVRSDLGDLNSYSGTPSGSSRVNSIAGTIVSAIQVIGTVVSVAVLIVIGIKYMLGSVEEKADYKKSLVPYIVGAFLLFTGTLIPQLIYTISQNFNK